MASVRRNSRLASLKLQDQAASASASAQAAYATLTDMMIDTWSESQLKEFCDKRGIKGLRCHAAETDHTNWPQVPQGTKQNELRALVRRNRAQFLNSASSAYGAATSSAGNQYARATDTASNLAQEAFQEAVNTWSESRLKSYLDARGVVCARSR